VSAPKWQRISFGDGFYWAFHARTGWAYYMDRWPSGEYQAYYNHQDADAHIGPKRKTRAAALNDCKRHALKLRAELVAFGRAKLRA
jgi:hypothetical protein